MFSPSLYQRADRGHFLQVRPQKCRRLPGKGSLMALGTQVDSRQNSTLRPPLGSTSAEDTSTPGCYHHSVMAFLFSSSFQS